MAAAFDFKKEYKDLYLPKTKPMLIDVPAMSFIAVAGSGNPNEENGDYAEALGLLYAFSFTVKMAKMGDWQPEGYFDYVVPPLEGLWWGGGFDGGRIGKGLAARKGCGALFGGLRHGDLQLRLAARLTCRKEVEVAFHRHGYA